MSEHSNIGWTNATWNPVRGCERVSEGCRNCYAEELAARHSYAGGWGQEVAKWVKRPDGSREARWTGTIQMLGRKLDEPLKWKQPKRIFVNSMSDLFHDAVDAEFVAEVFAVMARCPQHVFQILTKRPARMLQLLKHDMPYEGPEWPLKNVWLGVSVEDQATADERIPILLSTPADVRWISAEPLLQELHLRNWLGKQVCCGNAQQIGEQEWDCCQQPIAGLDWVVVGGESGQGCRAMAMENARSIIHQCTVASVPTFVKQDNGPRPGMKGRFTDAEWALKEYPA